jgi:AcrR family transcriptional regulator
MPRPLCPLITQEVIADAALSLIDQTGSLTLAALAKRIGVRPSSFYNHVKSRADILFLVRLRAFKEYPQKGDVTPEELRQFLLIRLGEMKKHPRIVHLLIREFGFLEDPVLVGILTKRGASTNRASALARAVHAVLAGAVLTSGPHPPTCQHAKAEREEIPLEVEFVISAIADLAADP